MVCGRFHSVADPPILCSLCCLSWCVTDYTVWQLPLSTVLLVDCQGMWPITQCGSSPYLIFSLLTVTVCGRLHSVAAPTLYCSLC